jgi:hypothetical protein
MTNRKKLIGWTAAAVTVIVVLIAGALYLKGCSAPSATLTIEHSDRIDRTPQTVVAIREIGQWEFLSIADEELIDTTRRGFFSDDHLARIYYGTLRLGCDLQQLADDAVSVSGDSIRLLLPPITLLDQNFIDEAASRSFHESGKWKPADREALYRRAQQRMKSRALTQQNLRSAEDNGREQVTKMLTAMGFKNVEVSFQPR